MVIIYQENGLQLTCQKIVIDCQENSLSENGNWLSGKWFITDCQENSLELIVWKTVHNWLSEKVV